MTVAEWLMCPPTTWATDDRNNVWMRETKNVTPNRPKAWTQWLDVYQTLADIGLVHLLRPQGDGLQDIVFTANLGVTFGDHAVVSHFTATARTDESSYGQAWFDQAGYDAVMCPHKFEGEADLKRFADGSYVGGYGQRTEPGAFDWMAKSFDVDITPVRLKDERLYHLDCSVCPLPTGDALVCVEKFNQAEIRAIEKHANVIDVSYDDACVGVCNNVVADGCIFNASNLHTLRRGSDEFYLERAKNRLLEHVADTTGHDLVLVNVDEFLKSGALLSCLVLPLTAPE